MSRSQSIWQISQLQRIWRRKNAVVVALVVAVAYVAMTEALIRIGLSGDHLAGVLVVPAVALGPVVAWGGALGVLFSHLSTGSVGAPTALAAVETFGLSYGAYALWGRVGILSTRERPVMTSLEQVAEYLIAVGVASVCTLATLAWLTVVLGTQPVFTGHVRFLTTTALAALFGPVMLFAFGRLGWASAPLFPDDSDSAGDPSVTAGLFVTGAGWYAASAGIGLMTHDVRLFPTTRQLTLWVEGLFGTGTLSSVAGGGLLFLYEFGDVVVVTLGVGAQIALVWQWFKLNDSSRCTGETAPVSVAPSRRNTLFMLAGLTVGTSTYGYATSGLASSDENADVATPERVAAAAAVAEIVYPDRVEVDESFVETFVFGRVEPRDGHFDGLAKAIDDVDEFARYQFSCSISSLSTDRRRRVLEKMGVYAVHASPDGTTAERIRYYLINDLVYALFSHPKGGKLLGVPNPPGYPGGNELYQRGPTDDSA